MTNIKLCGLSRAADIETANIVKPEYVGFVLWPKSSRFVSRSQTLELRRALLPEIRAVGVFVDEEIEAVAEYLRDGIIDIAQLHGSEDAGYISRLRDLAPGKEIIKALQIKDRESFSRQLEEFKSSASAPDFFLLDSGTGTGRTFNWEIIRDADIGRPYFLAGGLNPDNVRTAVLAMHPYGVDVSSGIETNGVKDPAKMEAFAMEAREI